MKQSVSERLDLIPNADQRVNGEDSARAPDRERPGAVAFTLDSLPNRDSKTLSEPETAAV
jgi:hypothetical protein